MSLPSPRQGIRQRRFGGPTVPITEQGDCWATVVACYAGLEPRDRNELHRRICLSDLALTRHGRNPQEGGAWWNVTQRFLGHHDRPPLTVLWEPDEVRPQFVYIASGPSPRGDFHHSILAYGDRSTHWDPHPSDDGVRIIEEWICWANPA